jgi:hypothetical protein
MTIMASTIKAMTELEQAQAQLAAKDREIEKLRKQSAGRLSVKIGPAGGLCFCGLQQFPINMFAQQAEIIRDWLVENLDSFIETNRQKLSFK